MSTGYPNNHDPLGQTSDPDPDHDPDPKWALEDMGEDDEDDEPFAPRQGIPWWVVLVAVLIALALLAQLGWPLLADFLDRGNDSSGFPTPGPV